MTLSPVRPSARSRKVEILVALTVGFFVPTSIAPGQEPPKKPAGAADGRVVGKLQFKSRKKDFEGIDVGIQDHPRRYIMGHPASSQRGIWEFAAITRGLASAPNDVVQARFTFSTFRISKVSTVAEVVVRAVSHTCPQIPPTGVEQRGEWQWADTTVDARGKTPKELYQAEVEAYRAKSTDAGAAKPGTDGWKAVNDLAEKYGYYEVRFKRGFEVEETRVDLPAGLFRNALKTAPRPGTAGKPATSLVSIYVKSESPDVLLGMVEDDVYLSCR